MWAGASYQYSTNNGATWTSFDTQAVVNEDLNYAKNVTFGPITGLTNLNQIQLRVVATATGLDSDSQVTVTAIIGNSSVTTAAVGAYDSGTLTVTINGHSDTVSYGAGSSSGSLTYALATAINNDSGAAVTASVTNALTVTAKQTGPGTDYAVSFSSTHTNPSFSTPSFGISGPVALSGGQNAETATNPLEETYTLDPWGNLQQAGNFNFVQAFTTNNQISGYSYDAAGDLLADGNGNTYSYNVEGMMTGSDGDQYVYDGLDQGVAKIGGTNASELIYFGGQMIALRNASTGAYTDMIWAGSNLLGVVAGTQTAAPSWRLVDHLGSLAVMTDNSGNVIATNVLAPYGQVLSSNAADPYPFAQMQYDTNGTSHAFYRNYGAAPGRWLSPDPYNGSYDLANPQSFNRYMYTRGNPLGFTDPAGLDPSCIVTDALSAVACAATLTYDGLAGSSAGAVAGFAASDLAPESAAETIAATLNGTASATAAAGGGSSLLGSVGAFLTNPWTIAAVGGALAVVELGDLFGWWNSPPRFTGTLQPRASVPLANGNAATPHIMDQQISNNLSSYKICTSGVPGLQIEGPPHIDAQPPGGPNGDMGVTPGEGVVNVGSLANSVTLSMEAACLRSYPLAALSPTFNDISASDAYSLSFNLF